MARAAHPGAMQPSRPAPTRTAAPTMSPKYPLGGRYASYIAFGACSIVFVLSSTLLLEWVWALGDGPEHWARVREGLRNPMYVAYHVVAVLAFAYTGWRFLIKLFAKSQPPRIGPLRPPPRAVFPPLLLGVWIVATVAVLVVAWGIFP